MSLSTAELAQARRAAAALLEELALDAYLFEVEPQDGEWEVVLECALEEGWETVTLRVAKERLLSCGQDAAVRRQMLEEWGARLAACKRAPPGER